MRANTRYLARYGHTITIGQTESGKTILNKRLAAWYKKHGIKVVVLDPMRDPGWNADAIFDDPEEYMAYVRNPDLCLQAALFIDEAGSNIGRYMQTAEWLTTQSRHHGMVCNLITQRAEMVNKTMREQCRTLFAFNVCLDDCKAYSRSFNQPQIMNAQNFAQGHCLQVTRFEQPKRWKLW